MVRPNQARRIMSKQLPMRVPDWVAPEQYQRFAVRLAALYYCEDGGLGALSTALGYSTTALHMALSGKGLNADHCIKLENLLGRDLFPREFFRPDIFIAE
jgi:hypothetical protein